MGRINATAVIQSENDPTNLAEWWRCSAKAPGTLKNRCLSAGLSTKCVLGFARGLRLVIVCRRDGCRPDAILNIADYRPRRKFLDRCGAASAGSHALPGTVTEYLDKQTFLRDGAVLGEVRRLLGIAPTSVLQPLASSLQPPTANLRSCSVAAAS